MKKRKRMRTKRVGMMRRVSLTEPCVFFPTGHENCLKTLFWSSTAGEAEEKNGAEEEAEEHPVKRPAEEEVGSSFSPHTDTNPDVPSTPNLLCFQEAVETKKQKKEENGDSTEAEVKA